MSTDDPVYIAYRSTKQEGQPHRFQLFSSEQEAFAWATNAETTDGNEATLPSPDSLKVSSFDLDDIKIIQQNFIDNILSYKSLISLTSFMHPVLMDLRVKSQIIDVAEQNYEIVSVEGDYSIRKVHSSQVSALDQAINSTFELSNGLSVLPGSILLSLVATFDSFVSDIAFRIVRNQRGQYAEDRKVSLKDIVGMDSIDEILDHVAWQDAQDCMRGSHASQVAFLEKLSNTKISGEYARWPEFVEIFERRNLVAHGNLIVNRLYLSNCAEAGVDISGIAMGTTLDLKPKYLVSCVDVLLEFGILLVYSLWKKTHKKHASKAYSNLNEISYMLIGKRHLRVASRILDFALHKQSRIGEDVIIKMMTINLANCYKKMNDNDKMNATLKSMDWSSSADRFKISIAALHEDVDRVVSLMPKVVDDDDVGKSGFRTWPVFDAIRDDDRFRKAFEDTFGDPIGHVGRSKAKELPDPTLQVNDESSAQ